MIAKQLDTKLMATKLLGSTASMYLLATAVIILIIVCALFATQMDSFYELTAVAPHPLPILDQ